ncbi:phosphatase PAP2 family protein [Deinococcus piscis]|uniref:Phosphatase PAP2 family protein n=1 Tax=Deinococcus piscis TaxID=394230 RepID=A0ABQ3K7P6_9DEIO|nr:phosphatase PAP2 family protein [Deinococcus piscis]GHG05684.1 phosphatase PAP2 family protein [Deinococcus piscis]
MPPELWLAITNLGRDEVFIAVLALYTWLISPQRARQLGVAFALSYLVNSALKYSLDLPRPFAADPAAAASEAARATAGGPSFPSGHAQLGSTLWLGMAAQLRRPSFWVVAALLAGLIAYSRIALGVHYPADVLAGVGLGLGFAALAGTSRWALPTQSLWRWGVPAALLLACTLIPAGTPRELPAGLGMLAGFWALRPDYTPPRTWTGRAAVALLGLALVMGLYLALSALLPDSWKALAAVTALRYAALVLFAGVAVPRLLRRWLPLDVSLATEQTPVQTHPPI